MLNIYKAAYKPLVYGSTICTQKQMDDFFELLSIDVPGAQMLDHGGFTTIQVELEDANYIDERDTAIDRMKEIGLIDDQEAKTLYQDTGILEITFAR